MRFNCQNAFDIWEPRLIEMHVYAYACNYNTCTVLRMNIFPINLTILTFLTFVTFVPLFEKSANKFKLRNIFRLHSHFDWRDMRVYLLFNCKLDLFGCQLMFQHYSPCKSYISKTCHISIPLFSLPLLSESYCGEIRTTAELNGL